MPKSGMKCVCRFNKYVSRTEHHKFKPSSEHDCKQIRKIESMAPVFPAKDNSGSVWIIAPLHVKGYASVIRTKHTSDC